MSVSTLGARRLCRGRVFGGLMLFAMLYFSLSSVTVVAATAYRLSVPTSSVCPTCVYSSPDAACQSALHTKANWRPYHYKHYTAGGACIYWWDPYEDGRQVDTSLGYGPVSDACPNGQQRVNGLCVRINSEKNAGKNACPNLVGNPINSGQGDKVQTENDYVSPVLGQLEITRYYSSFSRLLPSVLAHSWGWNWRGFYDRAIAPTAPEQMTVYRQDGGEVVYAYNVSSSVWQAEPGVQSTLESIDGGWKFWDADRDEVELYDSQGRLLSIATRSGLVSTLTYTDGTAGENGGFYIGNNGVETSYMLPAGLLSKVVDGFGRALQFKYLEFNLVGRVIDPSGRVFRYQYDGATRNLLSVTYPDGKARTYKYNESTFNGGVDSPYLLTGIVDENTKRFAYFQYDSAGRAVASFRYVSGYVERVSLTYTTGSDMSITSAIVTDARNQARTYSFTNILGVSKYTAVSQPCPNCSATSSKAYDAVGNLSSSADFNGHVTNYTYDLNRNLQISRTEASGTSSERLTATTWHPDFRVPLTITESGKVTNFSYDSSGNLLSASVTSVSQ